MHDHLSKSIPPTPDSMRALTLSILGAAAVAAGVLLVRGQKAEDSQPKLVPAGETVPAVISLERLRELGI